jgi:hypothetical protein
MLLFKKELFIMKKITLFITMTLCTFLTACSLSSNEPSRLQSPTNEAQSNNAALTASKMISY